MSPRTTAREPNSRSSVTSPDVYLASVCDHSTVLRHKIRDYGDLSLIDYLEALRPSCQSTIQPLTDLLQVVYNYVLPLLGHRLAAAVSSDLLANPVVLTANHHGVDYFAQSVQGSLLFALSRKNASRPASTVPVFSCGNVPLDNLTYPMGVLIYHVTHNLLSSIPRKIPIFANSQRRAMVSVSPPLTQDLLTRAMTKISVMTAKNQMPASISASLSKILDQDYCSPQVINLPNYSQQSVILNNRIWKRLFRDPCLAPELIYLELEQIVGNLLLLDLPDSESLVSRVFFEPDLRFAVLSELDGKTGCWNLSLLAKRLRVHASAFGSPSTFNNCGSVFFWGVNQQGRRIPLTLETIRGHNSVLRGVDDHAKPFELPFTVESLIAALNHKRILPSIFTCFLEVAFARGVTCVGGYFQTDYLPAMQKAFAKALGQIGRLKELAWLISCIDTGTYLSGMQTVMVRTGQDQLIPAGPVEIIASGGLTENDLLKMPSLSFKEAHLASLFDTVPDLAPGTIRNSCWQKKLATACSKYLAAKIVVKEP